MDSYARYRMTDWNWIAIYKEKMGVDLFREYVNGVYNELLNMKVDRSFSLEATVKEENRELFIKIVCMFIHALNSVCLVGMMKDFLLSVMQSYMR